jgi:hypothetical protein
MPTWLLRLQSLGLSANAFTFYKGEEANPRVTISVQTPIFSALSFLKNISVTTALPTAAAGEMKNATKIRQTICEA